MSRLKSHRFFSRYSRILITLVCALCVAQSCLVLQAQEPAAVEPRVCSVGLLKLFIESLVAGRAGKKEQSNGWNITALVAEQIPTPAGPYSLPYKNKSASALQKWTGAGLQVLGTLVRMGGNLVRFHSNNKKQKFGGLSIGLAGFVAQEEGRKMHPGIPPVIVTVGDGTATKSKDGSVFPDVHVVGKKLATTMNVQVDPQVVGVKCLDDASLALSLPLIDKSYCVKASVAANKKLWPLWLGRFRPIKTQYNLALQHSNSVQNVRTLKDRLTCWFEGHRVFPRCLASVQPDIILFDVSSKCEHDNRFNKPDDNKIICKKVNASGKLLYLGSRLFPAWMGRWRPAKLVLEAGVQHEFDKESSTCVVGGSIKYDETLMPQCLGCARPQTELTVNNTIGSQNVNGAVSFQFKHLFPRVVSLLPSKVGTLAKVFLTLFNFPQVGLKASTSGALDLNVSLNSEDGQPMVTFPDISLRTAKSPKK